MQICEVKECVGCFACKSTCHVGAIHIIEDRLGRRIPEVDDAKCIQCGACQRVCPVNTDTGFQEPINCYAVQTINTDDKKNCSSGGVSTGIARDVIRRGGIVFGASYLKGFELVMCEATSEEDIIKFRGSKYVNCANGDSYSRVKELLEGGHEVLYVGVPCQIAGLKSYLGNGYDRLYLIDIICHGTPPFRYLKEYCEEKFGSDNVEKVEFRGEFDFSLSVFLKGGRIERYKVYDDLYFWGFMESLFYRENCYSCKYAQRQRQGNLTIGDFWGLDRQSLKQSMKGKISVVLVNDEVGDALLGNVQESFLMEERAISEAVEGNLQLRRPSHRHANRNKFERLYGTVSFNKVLRKTVPDRDMYTKRLENSYPYKIVRKIYRAPRRVLGLFYER